MLAVDSLPVGWVGSCLSVPVEQSWDFGCLKERVFRLWPLLATAELLEHNAVPWLVAEGSAAEKHTSVLEDGMQQWAAAQVVLPDYQFS
jgi:hypothetical protein